MTNFTNKIKINELKAKSETVEADDAGDCFRKGKARNLQLARIK